MESQLIKSLNNCIIYYYPVFVIISFLYVLIKLIQLSKNKRPLTKSDTITILHLTNDKGEANTVRMYHTENTNVYTIHLSGSMKGINVNKTIDNLVDKILHNELNNQLIKIQRK